MPDFLESLANRRIVLVAAHPDDETIGAGTRLPRWRDVFVVHATDGAPRDLRDASAYGFATWEDYARARRQEACAALALAGVPPDRVIAMGLPDQQASFQIEELAHRLAALFQELRPEIVLTHPYEGGHPDHDATALAVHAACRMARTPVPVAEFASYHARAHEIETGEFLPCDGCRISTAILTQTERDLKRRMLACYATQQQTLSQFAVERERFRPAPAYDFTRPPHPGPVYYDRFDWGVTGAAWLELARAALERLGIQGPL